ncbi:MAG: 5-formyltetrahydrofolate cyclo-ligase [Balneolaceae bacterium]
MKSPEQRKRELRKKVLSERQQISEDIWREKSEKICTLFLESEQYQQADFIHCYVSMNNRNEVNTWNLIREMLAGNKKVAVPVTNFSETSLIHSTINSTEELSPNKWGIYEPEEIETVDIQKLDAVIIPMAAADRKGNRLGYGKGFYDRFLSQTEALKIGFVFSEFIFEEIPAADFDKKMDVLISEKGVIHPKH